MSKFSDMQSNSFSYIVEEPGYFTNNFVHFVRQVIDSAKIADIFCSLLVTAMDAYLKEKIEQLSFRHSLSSGP